MSRFDKYTTSDYLEAMRIFLGWEKKGFVQKAGLVAPNAPPKRGRIRQTPDQRSAITAMELLVNEKARLAESPSSSVGERVRIARDYLGYSDAQVARELGVSRELIRRWGAGQHQPTRMAELAAVLDVPEKWLEQGGEQNLPANSHVGVRVGEEALQWRERLYGLTLPLVAELPDEADLAMIQAFIEKESYARPSLAGPARRAGGRWQSVGYALLFAPWDPIPDHGLSRRYWSDEVETIIKEELSASPSVYGAWHALRDRCKAKGLTEYPKLISLHKRLDKEKERVARYGVNLNEMVAGSVSQYRH